MLKKPCVILVLIMLNAVKTLQSRLNLAKLYNLRRISLCASYRILTLSQNYLKNDEQIMKCLTNPYTVVNKVYLSSKANGNSPTNGNEFNELKFENFCSETLEALSDYFDELVEKCSDLSEADVTNNVNSWSFLIQYKKYLLAYQFVVGRCANNQSG